MRVGIDLDGVTLDFHRALVESYEEWFGVKAPAIKKWDDPLELLHFDTYSELWDWCERADVWGQCSYVPGAPGAIDHFVDRGDVVVFLTSRSDSAALAAGYWHAQSPWYKSTQLVTDLGDTKHRIPCTAYIDDSPIVISNLHWAGKNVIAFDRPWNQDVHKDIRRAKAWSEVITLVEELET